MRKTNDLRAQARTSGDVVRVMGGVAFVLDLIGLVVVIAIGLDKHLSQRIEQHYFRANDSTVARLDRARI